MRAFRCCLLVILVGACASPPKPASAPQPPMLRLGGAPDEPLVILPPPPPPPGPAAQIAVGPTAACARTPDGRVACWGPWGSERRLPTIVDGLDDAIDVAVGIGHACARRRTGAVVCWGSNRSFWEGMASTHMDPVADIPGLAGAIAIGHGAYFACALGDDHRVRCMGSNTHGELGDGTLVGRAEPALVPGLTDVRELAVGTTHACARLADGSVRCWGDNADGQLGDGTATAHPTPVEVAGLRGAVEIAAGDAITCARTAAGAVTCWGEGLAITAASSPGYASLGGPGHPFAPWTGARQIWAGHRDACARLADDRVACIGGLLSDTGKALAGVVHPAGIGLGEDYGCVLSDRGEVGCWGDNEYGQRGASSNRTTPAVVFGLANIASLVAGDLTTCAILADRTVRCWGRVPRAAPMQVLAAAPVAMPELHDVASLSADEGACAVMADGTVACAPGSIAIPQLADVAQLVMTQTMQCARKTSGDVACWDNYHREPRVVAKGAVQVAGTFEAMCARLANQRVTCWGDDLLTGKRPTDAMVATAAPGIIATDLAVGADFACVLVTGGRVRCWGDSGKGQLGDGKAPYQPRPAIDVAGIAGATAIAAGAYHTCALLATRTVRCWGWNRHGQIGDGTFEDALTPHDVVGLRDVVQIVAHGTQSCARLADGTARCWGDGEEGQIGDATDGFDPHSHVTPVSLQRIAPTPTPQ